MADGGFAGLDRKAMEQDRLARQKNLKRPRSISPPPTRNTHKASKVEETSTTLPSGAMLKSFSTLVNEDQRGRKSESATAASQRLKADPDIKLESDTGSKRKAPANQQSHLQYSQGVVKKTWAFGFDRTGDDVKLEEVLEPRTLRTAVLSAFQWNTEWLQAKTKTPVNGGETKLIYVMQAKEDALRKQMFEETKDMKDFLRLCLPSMFGQINCMHSKLMLLFHPNKLRIAIPTANLLNFDWGETGLMENSVFMIDLTRDEDAAVERRDQPNEFCTELLFFLEKQGLHRDVRDSIFNFDFTATDHMRFIHTVGGANLGPDGQRTGLPGLSRAVRQLNLQADADLQLDFAASSIGSLHDDMLRNFHAAARGEDLTQLEKATASNAQANFFKPSSKPSTNDTEIRSKLRIYFPTYDTVRASLAGAAGTICLNRKWWEDMKFPRSVFRDYKSIRTGLLSHNKILYARGKQTGEGGKVKDVAWAYVGSANMSESAWGKLVFDKKAKDWKVNCRNWECGVLMTVPEEELNEYRETKVGRKLGGCAVKWEIVPGDDSETESESEDTDGSVAADDIVGMEVFDKIAKPPFEIPGDEFGDREPWYFMEYQ